MRIRHGVIALFFVLFSLSPAYALLSMELTQGVSGAVPIVVVPFAEQGGTSFVHVSEIINNDLAYSGRFNVYNQNALSMRPTQLADISFPYFRHLGTDNIVMGRVEALGNDQYQVSFQLLDAFKATNSTKKMQHAQTVADHEAVILNQKFRVSGKQLRQAAHHISDLIYGKILGMRGIFSTRLAYVVVKRFPQGSTRYTLEVADADGYNPRVMLTSTDPIMSPAWAPDGRRIAYVSFEKRRAAIYIQDVVNGHRQLVSELPGINGAPAWSPDGRKLALVLSKGVTPNIYVLDLGSHHLTQITRDDYINTEPAWAPNGKYMVFTSTRGGSPQIYQYHFSTHAITRMTYDGNYNARAGFTADGNRLVAIHKERDAFNIGLFDLDNGAMRLLTPSGTRDSSSPSVAPNGSMVLYDTVYRGRNMLAIVSTDGRVQLRLPARDGEAQDPAWSPFLS